MSILSNANAMSSEAYVIGNSLRFQSASSQYLSRTPSSSTNRQIFTWSAWVKRGQIGSGISSTLISTPYNTSGASNTVASIIYFDSDTLKVESYETNTTPTNQLVTTQLFRDPSAWYHVVVAVDTTQATASNRVKVYVNGTQVTAFSTASYPALNYQYHFNQNVQHVIGSLYLSNLSTYSNTFDGYQTDVYLIDGQQLTPSSFGYNNPYTGVWVAKKYTGSYGTNGFYLPFLNGTSTATLGVDYSGNNNNWNLNNFSLSTTNVPLQFTTVGTTQWKVPTGVTSISYVVVGGGAGGASYAGGGGGAGGFVEGTLSVTPGNTVAITVGAGGAASANGGNSSLGGVVIAYGGGTGGSDGAAGTNGGSGGGGGTQNGTTNWGTSIQTSPAGGTGYGNRGGAKSGGGSYAGGGGGGAGAVGADSTGLGVGGAGGAGRASSITGASVTYAGGGGGFGYYTGGAGGSGGGGAGSTISGTGANATGYGCGGGSGGTGGGSGSQGIVIIQYAVPSTTWPWMKDVPSGNGYRGLSASSNYAVMNPLKRYTANMAMTNGNLTVSDSSTANTAAISSMRTPTSGKWYWEITATTISSSLGYVVATTEANADSNLLGGNLGGYRSSGTIQNLAGTSQTSGASYTNGDVIGIAVDIDAGTCQFYKNNVAQGATPSFSFTAGTVLVPGVATDNAAGTKTFNFNFGQRSFAYTPPTGFLPLCAANLPVPTILQGNKFMDATTYTGNGGTQSIVNAGAFQPDLVWCKQRNAIDSNLLFDSVRGATKWLSSNLTNVEGTVSGVSAFNSNGFTLGGANVNTNGDTFVGWQWQAGKGTTTSNTSGSITSTVSVNPTAGFSVAIWTNTGSIATIGHGLGVAPKMIIVKGRSGPAGATNWKVYHSGVNAGVNPQQYYLTLNSTAAQAGLSNVWNDTAPTSSVFTVGTNSETGGTASELMLAYCFAEISGFSKFGSYTGNGSTDGTFVYLGFRPKYVMWKRSDAAESWVIEDTSRNTYNVANAKLYANDPSAEDTNATYGLLDILSNGFKCRTAHGQQNASGGTYIYMAFAENPFNFSNAR